MTQAKHKLRDSYLSYVLTYFFFYFCMGGFTSILSVYLTDLGKDKSEMSFIVSASNLFGVVMIPFVGYLVDRLRRPKQIAAIMMLSASVCAGVFAVTRHTLLLFLLNGLIGAAIASVAPVFERMAGAGKYRYGTVRVWGTFGYAAAAQLSGTLMELSLSPMIFVCFAISAAITVFGFFLTAGIPFSDASVPDQKKDENRFSFLKLPMFLLFLVVGVIFSGLSNLNMTYTPVLLQDIQLSKGLIGTVISISTVVELPLILLSHRFMDRFQGKTLMLAAFVILLVQFAVYGLCPNPIVIILTVLIFRALGATLFLMIVLKMVRNIVQPSAVSTAMGVVNAANALASIAFQNLGGLLANQSGVPALYLALCVAAVLGLVLSLLLRVKNRNSSFA